MLTKTLTSSRKSGLPCCLRIPTQSHGAHLEKLRVVCAWQADRTGMGMGVIQAKVHIGSLFSMLDLTTIPHCILILIQLQLIISFHCQIHTHTLIVETLFRIHTSSPPTSPSTSTPVPSSPLYLSTIRISLYICHIQTFCWEGPYTMTYAWAIEQGLQERRRASKNDMYHLATYKGGSELCWGIIWRNVVVQSRTYTSCKSII